MKTSLDSKIIEVNEALDEVRKLYTIKEWTKGVIEEAKDEANQLTDQKYCSRVTYLELLRQRIKLCLKQKIQWKPTCLTT